jgi:FAD-dependent oxidoreductase domain-containing protein 1
MRILVIGGGAVGSAAALFLKHLGGTQADVQVVERDSTYSRASSALSAGSIRQQFSTPLNIAMSRFGFELIGGPAREWLSVEGEPADLDFVPSGYLFLATEGGRPTLAANHAVQVQAGADVLWLEPAALAQRFPWLAADGLAAAALGLSREGWFDGYSFTRALRRKAVSLGARYRHAAVAGLQRSGDRLISARLDDGTVIEADVFVNAAGPWAREIGALCGVEVPVSARRRTVFALGCPTPLPLTPLVIDPSGVWFRSEGSGFIAGWSPGAGQADPDDLPLDADLALFEEVLWPALAGRVPAFEALRVQRAWAGYYEVNPFDHNAWIGPHPEMANFVQANGFSGHGLQHAPAAGRGVAEWLLHGRYETLDLSPLHMDRWLRNAPYVERNVI